jgi:hypothetical protein
MGPRYLVYIHFEHLGHRLVEGVYVHPVQFATAGKAYCAEKAWRGALAPHLPDSKHSGGECRVVEARSVAQAQQRVIRYAVSQGWKGLAFVDRYQLASR